MRTKWTLGIGLVSLWVGSQLLSGRAEAQAICGTLAECRAMDVLPQERFGQTTNLNLDMEGDAPGTLGAIVRDSIGRARHMDHYDAERYCREQGSRLPTLRELAVYAQSLGACGLLSPSEYENFKDTLKCRKSNYYRVRVAASATEPADEFYFNYRGYRRPAGDMGNYWFWASSVALVSPHVGGGLNGARGYINFNWRIDRSVIVAVRCVRRSHRD